MGAGNQVDHNRYWCLDVTRSAIELGRRHFPRAHFEHYDRYSSYFNPNGVHHLPVPELGVKFDVVLAFSVFTHMHQKEMIELIGQLRRMLAPRGAVAFTFCDPLYESSQADSKPSPRWYVEVGGQLHVEPGDQLCQQERSCQQEESYCSYFTADYMTSLFPGATVHPPVSPERQHCCILRRSERTRCGWRERSMELRFHWMLPKAGEVSVDAPQTPQEAARYRIESTRSTSPAPHPDVEGWLHFARHAEDAGIDVGR